ncbi:MAG: amino acid permease [Actinobacteria bacterium]|nr:amino acid permease [Actinomycetota bacterium]MCA1698305.1 amino acid permease [Actinomycetota bacterium]
MRQEPDRSRCGVFCGLDGRTPPAGSSACARGQRAVCDRLRQRRVVNLLRAGSCCRTRAGPDAAGLCDHRHLLFCTAATYAEATAMFPEAGGSSSFARHAFNEFVSFFAAWAQMLNYVITVAISAFLCRTTSAGCSGSRCDLRPATSSSAPA